MRPDLEDLDQESGQVREATASRLAVAEELDRLNFELRRLRAILCVHGMEPVDDDVA